MKLYVLIKDVSYNPYEPPYTYVKGYTRDSHIAEKWLEKNDTSEENVEYHYQVFPEEWFPV